MGILCLALILTPLLTSCSVPKAGQDVPLGFELPNRWTAAKTSAKPIIDNWWSEIGSSQLNEIVMQALDHNQDLKIAAARLAAAEAEAKIAGAELTPSLGLGFDADRSQRNFIGFPIPGSDRNVLTTRSTTYGVALNSSWELDLWGRVRSGKRAATAEAQASEQEFRGARQSIAAQAAKAWLAVNEASQQLNLAKKSAQSHQLTLAQIRDRYRLGIRSSRDLRLAETAFSSSQAAVSERKRLMDRATRQLEILIGKYPSGLETTEGRLPQIADMVPSGLPSELLSRRPDLAAAKRRLEAADDRVFQSKASLLPRISLTTSGGTSTAALTDLISSDFGIWTLAGNFSQPLLQGGRLREGVKLSQARTRQALAQYRKTALTAFAEVESTLAAETHLSNRERDLATASTQAQAALDLARERYAAGIENLLSVLESERRTLDTESLRLTVLRERIENRVDLHVALGGGFLGATPAAESETKTTSAEASAL